MIKKICILLVVVTAFAAICMIIQPQSSRALGLFGNKQLFDFDNKFTYAIIFSPGGDIVKQGTVESWRDFEDGDQLQVKIDGVTYLTHASLIILSTK